METLEQAVTDLRAVLAERSGPRRTWHVRQQLSAVREALLREPTGVSDGWLIAREATVCRDRDRLVLRIQQAGRAVLDGRGDHLAGLQRLASDLERHSQRVSDLVYDSVALELGGSE